MIFRNLVISLTFSLVSWVLGAGTDIRASLGNRSRSRALGIDGKADKRLLVILQRLRRTMANMSNQIFTNMFTKYIGINILVNDLSRLCLGRGNNFWTYCPLGGVLYDEKAGYQ